MVGAWRCFRIIRINIKRMTRLTRVGIMTIPELSKTKGPTGIGKHLKCSTTTALKWMNQLEKEGHIIIRQRPGAKKTRLK